MHALGRELRGTNFQRVHDRTRHEFLLFSRDAPHQRWRGRTFVGRMWDMHLRELRSISDSARLFPNDSTLFHLSRRESQRMTLSNDTIREKGQFGGRSDAPATPRKTSKRCYRDWNLLLSRHGIEGRCRKPLPSVFLICFTRHFHNMSVNICALLSVYYFCQEIDPSSSTGTAGQRRVRFYRST